VIVEGSHSFRNVDLLGTSRLVHAATTLTNEGVFQLTLWSMHVESNAAINVTGRGYLGGQQSGNPVNEGRTTNNALGATVRSAGSHGGLGGTFGGTPNALYGNLIQPTDLGSGGSSRGDNAIAGGNGGGRIRLNLLNLAADGGLRADGNAGNGFQAGSGSGGSIFILTRTLSGLGLITANGGVGEVGGGGGRVGIHYTDMATKDPALIRAIGGDGGNADGGNGTVFLKGPEEQDGTLVVDGQGIASPFSGLPIPVGVIFDNIIIRNTARVVADDPIVVRNALEIQTGSILTHSVNQTNGLRIIAKSVVVDGTSAIDVSAKGYRGGQRDGNANNQGETLYGQLGANVRSGGSYGGLGGVFDGVGGNLAYGTPYDPIYLGAGGSSRGDNAIAGGNGGGRITMVASNNVTVLGAIRADGQAGSGFLAGSGAGGSIKIETEIFQGSGSVTANGGVNEVGGGGGRIAVTYSFVGAGTNDFDDLRNVTASGGKGANRHGSAGTVLMRQSSQAIGDLYLDATTTNALASLWSPLTPIGLGRSAALTTNTLTLDGAVSVLPGGLAGVLLQPNIEDAASFTIIENTATTITVAVNGTTNLTSVANVGDVYAAAYRFDNVILRRGAWLVTSDKLTVNQEFRITENSVVTHYNSNTNFIPGMDITAGTITVSSNSAINVDGRGYLGGQAGNNTSNFGRTTNNADGASVRSAGSHGGIGGVFGGVPNPIYGDVKTPVELGSGGSSRGDNAVAGGNGGGRIRLAATLINVDGIVSADGSNGFGFQAGSGSGGSILINAGTVTGSGVIRANGGAGEVGGGGGRIAAYFNSLVMPATNLLAISGNGGNSDGGHGTLFFKSTIQSLGDLVIDGANSPSPDDSALIPGGYEFDNITLRNQAKVLADSPVTAVSTFNMLSGSRISHTRGFESGLVITSAQVLVDAASTIDASAKGYRGGQRDGYASNEGETLTNLVGAQVKSGGSYGGRGGTFSGAGSNQTYGEPAAPVWLGSGGSSRGDNAVPGGNGGGRITIVAANELLVAGTILANGQIGNGFQAGSGSGGSIKLVVGTLSGSGSVRANGGVGEVGGGGGRVAVFYTNLVMSATNLLATGGDGGNSDGGHGTVLLRSNIQTNGDLIVDGYGFVTVSDSTPIPTNIVFDNVIFRNGARIQLAAPLVVEGSVQIISNAAITHVLSDENGLRIESGSLFIGTNSSIDVSARGYRGGQRDGNGLNEGLTTNGTSGSTVKSGGSYGGLGGTFSGGTPNPVYGVATNPIHLGSGGSSRGDNAIPGGNGGGRVTLLIIGTLEVNGTIRANGQNGNGFQAGGGSGGSVKIQAGTLTGGGTIEAIGGGSEVAGGGGRIAVYTTSLSFNTNQATSAAGVGANSAGSPGTVYFGASPGPFGLFGLPSAPSLAPLLLDANVSGQHVVVVWNVDGDGVYAVQFSPDLMPSAWTTLQYIVNPVWTGTLPMGAERGFIRVIQEE
jgi:hypothetical protein